MPDALQKRVNEEITYVMDSLKRSLNFKVINHLTKFEFITYKIISLPLVLAR